ncbi:putative DNA-binding domain-containing protein [Undibacterium sp. Ji50W]|uniref:HvfC/BufC family peptide modification chaperone n=1 Tax=Undibacterium sp. Ji50W TaxID=3413041 RepID=UPI003BF1FE04
MSASSLAQIQQQFAAALLQPKTATDAADAAELFAAHPAQDDRLALYRGNLTAIWTAALRNAYPVLHALVGEDYFAQMARSFGRSFPSESGDLNDFGAHLPAFLTQTPDAADYPYFSDVAALEWQIHRAYYAADADSMSLPALVQLVGETGQDLQQARFELHPAFGLHASDWATVAIWLAHQPGTQTGFPNNIRHSSYGLILRTQWSVELTEIQQPAYLALQALRAGASLSEALEAAVNADCDFDINSNVQAWFHAGLFTKVRFSDDSL